VGKVLTQKGLLGNVHQFVNFVVSEAIGEIKSTSTIRTKTETITA